MPVRGRTSAAVVLRSGLVFVGLLCCLAGCEDDGYIGQLRTGTVEQRAQAATFLGAQREARGIPALRAALLDTAEAVRAKSAWALGMLIAREALPELVTMLQDPSRRVRQQVVGALMNMEEPEVIPALETALLIEKDSWIQGDIRRAIAFLRQFEGEQDLGEASFR